jgi:hypothetical protein
MAHAGRRNSASRQIAPSGRLIAVFEARTPAEALFDGVVALVVVAGRIRLISPDLAGQLPSSERRRFQLLRIDNRPPVLVDADVRGLRRDAVKHLGQDIRLAGKRILS